MYCTENSQCRKIFMCLCKVYFSKRRFFYDFNLLVLITQISSAVTVLCHWMVRVVIGDPLFNQVVDNLRPVCQSRPHQTCSEPFSPLCFPKWLYYLSLQTDFLHFLFERKDDILMSQDALQRAATKHRYLYSKSHRWTENMLRINTRKKKAL